MELWQLWWTGVISPRQAFDELGSKPAPQWGFWVALTVNLAISAFSLLPLYLLGTLLTLPFLALFAR